MAEVRQMPGATTRPAPEPIMLVEAEQQLLGALLVDASRLDILGGLARTDLFADPVHRDLFDAIRRRHDRDELVTIQSMYLWAEGHPGMSELGGPRYLARLVGASITGSQVQHYARILDEVRAKRAIAAAVDAASRDLRDDASRASEISARLEAALVGDAIRADDGPVSMLSAATEALSHADDAYNGRATPALPTGVQRLDQMINGLYPGDLVLLGGRPSQGKTGIALSLALNVARAGQGVCFASLEMTPDALAFRALGEATTYHGNAVPYTDIRRGQINASQFGTLAETARSVAELPFHILPPTYRDIGAIYAGCKRVRAQLGPDTPLRLIVVDYLQLVRSPGRKSRFEEITDISIALKGLAGQMGCPVLALSQLSRQVEGRDDKRPVMSDLRESGQLEQDADTIMFCYRDSYYAEREEPQPDKLEAHAAWQNRMERARNRLEIIVAKQRQGPIGTAHVGFNPALNKLWDL